MPNISRITGLRPIAQPYGSLQANVYEAATGTALFMYHPVDLDAGGRVVLATPNSGNLMIGTIVGLADDALGPPSDSFSGYIPANPASINSAGLVKVLVADDPNQLFLIEEDTGGTALASTNRGNGGSFTYIGTTGSTVSGVASVVLDRSGVDSVNANQQFRLIKKWDKPDNDYGNFCKWVV